MEPSGIKTWRQRIREVRDTARRMGAIRSAQHDLLNALECLFRWRENERWDDIIFSIVEALKNSAEALDHEVGSLLTDEDDDIPF